MGYKVFLLHFILLFCCCCLSAQQQQDPFYYYKGEQVLLPVNSQYFLVYADAEKISKELFAKEYRVTEWVENGGNGLIEAQVCIPNGNYDSVVNVLKARNYVVDVEPVIGDSNMLVNTSRLFYVKLHNPHDYPLLCDMSLRTGVEISGEVAYCEKWYELSVDKNSTGNSIETSNRFWETGNFADVDPGFLFHFESTSAVSTCVTDPRFVEQWGLQTIKACSAWKITKGDTNVRIALIDKGMDEGHREFDSTHVVFSYDMDTDASPARIYCEEQLEIPYRDQIHPGDPPVCVYHGINVGGVIFANHNRDSIAGVCPNAGLINISHAFKLREDSIASKMARAINMSILYGARVINNSWRIKDNISAIASELLEDAINNALLSDCVVVFAAGNGTDGISNNCVSYPARCNSDILTVGAVTPSFVLSHCSNYGDGLDIVAPGSEILSTHNDNGYSISQGTSMAAPHVSGVAGLMFSINPGLTGQDVRDIIEQTAIKNPDYNTDTLLENGTWCSYYGYGLLDAHRAVLKAAYHKVYGDTALTLCDTNCHAYTVRAPHNANIDSVSFFWTCSDNLQTVAGQNTDSVWVKRIHGGTGQLQCHIIHDGDTVTSSIEIPVLSNRPVYDNVSLSGGFSFPDTFVLSREIVIDSLAGLYWQNKTVLCTPDCRIIVRPGGFMTLDHTTLTSACANRMWQGIEVTGNSGQPQILHNQGTLHVENGSVIENAFTAVRNCLATDNVYVTTGGVVQASSSTFRNNRRAVEFNSYAYSSNPELIPNYISSFNQCTFTVNDQNLFAANDTVFTEHVKLWEVRGVPFRGCGFYDSTSTPVSGRRGVFTEDAGIILDTYCDFAYSGCECPESHSTYSSFFGFTTGVEVNTTGFQFPVTVNQVRFSNNCTGVRVNGNLFATVTRNIFNLNNSPLTTIYSVGLDLNNSTGYSVEENTFHKDYNYSTAIAQGIKVRNSTTASNKVYRNSFQGLDYGIYVSGTNGDYLKGLQILCNNFSGNGTDIYIAPRSTVSPNQGNANSSAGNTFDKKVGMDIVNDRSQNINYYYTGNISGVYYPDQCSGLVTRLSASSANTCASLLCENGGNGRSLAGFLSNVEADTYYIVVRALMSDTALDLNELEQWHTAAQHIADPYSLTETRFMEGYAEPFVAYAEDAEMTNYADFHAMKLALRIIDGVETQNFASLQSGGHVNWYTLTPAQIAQLQTIAERNAGRASVMAKGVLCFFFDICYDDEDVSSETDSSTETRAKHTATGTPNDATLTVYPNPTNDLLFVELAGAEIANIVLYDLQGRVVETLRATSLQGATTTINLKSVPAGVYVLRVTDENNHTYHQRIIKE